MIQDGIVLDLDPLPHVYDLNYFEVRVDLVCRFPGDDIPIVRGSALAALEGKNDLIGK